MNVFKSVIAACLIAALSPATSVAFDAGEHALIGDTAFAVAAAGEQNLISNLEMDIDYSYGELLALSGDMYKSVEEIALSDALIMNGFLQRNRNSLKNCIHEEINGIRNNKVYGGCDDLKLASKKIRYVLLAHDNYTHFAWHNIKMYIEFHEKALWFAQLAHIMCTEAEKAQEKPHCGRRNKQLVEWVQNSEYVDQLPRKYRKLPKLFPRKAISQRYLINISQEKMRALALFANAYADHFLSDAFSAGHLRVPRSQIDDFVADYGKAKDGRNDQQREEGSAISGALTQFLHNNDGSMTGIKVTNSFAEHLIIRSDKQLFAKPDSDEMSNIVEQNPQLKAPGAAVAKSLKEVLDVLAQGEKALPKGPFAALYHVPFVVDAQDLSKNIRQSIAAEGSIKKAVESMSEEMQLIFRAYLAFEDVSYKTYFADFIDSLPKLMASLRAQIERESADEKISSRIPEPLLKALKTIQ